MFVRPTAAEAFGIAAIEANAAGLATIVTAVSSVRAIVVDDANGSLIQPDSVRSSCQDLRLLAGNISLRERMGKRHANEQNSVLTPTGTSSVLSLV